MPPNELVVLKVQLQDLLEKGLIQPSASPSYDDLVRESSPSYDDLVKLLNQYTKIIR